MRIVKTQYLNPDSKVVQETVDVLNSGGVIIYPTDTVYGIGCLLYPRSVKRLKDIKGRDNNKPLSIAVNKEHIRHYSFFEGNEITEGPYTYIVDKKPSVPDFVTGGLPTVGLRVFEKSVVGEIIKKCDKPIITTSANLSGKPPIKEISQVSHELIEKVDLIIDSGICSYGKPSRIIDLTRDGEIIRL